MSALPASPNPSLSRRDALRGTAAALVVTATAVLSPAEGWGLETANLKPDTMRVLIRAARDIYPHDRLPDRFYAVAVKPYDAAAADATVKSMWEDGVAGLQALAKKSHGTGYTEIGWEGQRVALLKQIETTPMFKKLRGDLVVSLYNQKDLWKLFGYEGESAALGGYIDRGFNDIVWL